MSGEYTLHKRIGFKVTRLARIMETRLESQLSEHGVTRLMWCALRGIGMENVTTPSQLADYICITRPAISRLLNTMEERGLVRRTGIDDDKRFTEVDLTELGTEKMKLCHVLVRELNDHFSSKVDQDSYELFMTVIDQMTEGENIQLMRL
ncbi:MarR family winged helix-turn-helix transcriptional regulator [Roseibium sp.]|uniref:MarR family winged helix-turn-helix transcriptional regulator n=1 Tax=Roseibium sp. TaxID=1936156 RepID=UPI003B520A2C